MKNHYLRTGLGPEADAARVDAALAETDDEERREDLDAASRVLRDPVRSAQYRRVHLQYRAMAAALDAIDDPIATNSHRWGDRLVEFGPNAA